MTAMSFDERATAAETLTHFVMQSRTHAAAAKVAQQELAETKAKLEKLEERLRLEVTARYASHAVFTAWATSLQFQPEGTGRIEGYWYKAEPSVTPAQMNELLVIATDAICKATLAGESNGC